MTAALVQTPQLPEAVLTHTMLVLDGIGTLAFALSGGLLGVRKRFDLFGVLFLSFVVAVAGGMMRDMLIGATPPAAITQVRYFAIAVSGGLITFYWGPQVALWGRGVLLLDAIGLGLFAVIGTQKAIAYGVPPAMAPLLGMLSGIGGGVTRDVLAGDRPFVLRGELYASAAFAAGVVVAIGHAAHGSRTLFALLGAAVCIFLRLMAMFRGWHAPLPQARDEHGP